MSVSAAWPLPRLLSALARAGWDELNAGRRGGGLRQVLLALPHFLPHGSATGLVTAHQLADATGLTERWVRSRLELLEAAGIITWTRGGIVGGQPTPSLIKVSKKALADLIRRARPIHDQEVARRAAETSARIRDTIRLFTLRRSQPRRAARVQKPTPIVERPVHAELSSALPPNGEVTDPSPVVYASLLDVRTNRKPGPRLLELRRRLAQPPSTA